MPEEFLQGFCHAYCFIMIVYLFSVFDGHSGVWKHEGASGFGAEPSAQSRDLCTWGMWQNISNSLHQYTVDRTTPVHAYSGDLRILLKDKIIIYIYIYIYVYWL